MHRLSQSASLIRSSAASAYRRYGNFSNLGNVQLSLSWPNVRAWATSKKGRKKTASTTLVTEQEEEKAKCLEATTASERGAAKKTSAKTASKKTSAPSVTSRDARSDTSSALVTSVPSVFGLGLVEEVGRVESSTNSSTSGSGGEGPLNSLDSLLVGSTGSTWSLVELRDYQEEAIQSVLQAFRSGAQRQLLSMPTGAGKTVVFCSIAQRMQSRTLILIHREELVAQTVAAIKRVWPESSVGVVQGTKKQYDRDVVVAMVQTASNPKPLAELARLDFRLLIVDEAHHATAPSYMMIMETLGFLSSEIESGPSQSQSQEEEAQKFIVGVTATPYRRDKAMLSDVFEDTVYEISIGELIELGYLCKVRAHRIITYTDISQVEAKTGKDTLDSGDEDDDDDEEERDFNLNQLTKVINTPERNALVVDSYNTLADGRKAVAFCCSIEHGTDLANMFIAKGVSAACLHSKLGKVERVELLEQHRRGDIMVLTNVGILTEGYDDTSISCVLMTRPTKSKGLYTQCVGRGFRLNEQKEDCLVLDFTDIYHRLDSPSELANAKEVLGEGYGRKFHQFNPPPSPIVLELKNLVDGGEMDLFSGGAVEYAWLRVGGDYFLCDGAPGQKPFQQKSHRPSPERAPYRAVPAPSTLGTVRVHKEEQAGRAAPLWTVCRLKESVRGGPVSEDDWLPIVPPVKSNTATRALKIIEGKLGRQVPARLIRDARWRKEDGTDKQIDFLRDLGAPIDDLLAKHHDRKPSKGTLCDMISTFVLGKFLAGEQRSSKPSQGTWMDQPASHAQEKYINRLWRNIQSKRSKGAIGEEHVQGAVVAALSRGLDSRLVPKALIMEAEHREQELSALQLLQGQDRVEMSKGVAHDVIDMLKGVLEI